MTLTLDPRYPLIWRTPDTLQLGVDDPPVVLESVNIGHERMLSALSVGMTPAGLTLIGTESGLTAAQVEDFRRKVQPALVERCEPIHARIAIADAVAGRNPSPSPTVDRLIWRLAEAGLDPRLSDYTGKADGAGHAESTTELAVIVAHYVIAPQVRGLWLRRDIPHLPIVFGDTSVTIGPMIEPGLGPCLYCLELHHRDADSAWPALASQLLGRRSLAESAFLASETATLATRTILTRLAGAVRLSASSLQLDAETGEQTRRLHHRHPDCACSGIAEFSAPILREIGMVRSRRNADRSRRPTTTGAVSVPA